VTIRCGRAISRKGSSEVLKVKRIPPKTGWYLAGFADGEGSFNVSFRPRDDYSFPWKVSLCFNISQRDPVILSLYKRYLECGTMRQRRDGVWYYEVNNFTAIRQNVIPFFREFGFLSAKKKRDFQKFRKIAEIIESRGHLTREGIEKILTIRRDMNDGGKRKFAEEDIRARIEAWESSETTRQTARKGG
jgi:LAGLIDADG endonuclease